MRSTFSGLNMALLGLNASQKALDVTGQNLTNINTYGYTRQRLDQVSISPNGASPFMSKYSANVGQGVLVTGVSQIRDPFLDIQFRNQLTKVGTEDAKNQILQSIGQIFDDVDNDAIVKALDDIVKQLDTVSGQPGQDGNDSVIRSSFEVLFSALHQNATDLNEVKDNLVTGLQDTVVASVNKIMTKITELNQSIKNSQMLGNPALELKDQRNLLIDDLATYLPIEVTYEEVPIGTSMVEKLNIKLTGVTKTEPNPDYDGTDPTVPQTIEKPVYLIKDGECAELKFSYDDPTPGKGTLTLVKDASDPPVTDVDITDQLDRGILKGKLEMLNEKGIFGGDAKDAKGIGYYQNMLDNFVSTLATEMNKLNMEAGGGPLFVNGDVQDEMIPCVPGDPDYVAPPGENPMKVNPASIEGFTAMNIKIADRWVTGETKLMETGKTDQSTQSDNILKMKALFSTDKIKFEYTDGAGVKHPIYEGAMPNAYANIKVQFGIEKSATQSILDNHSSVLQEASDARESVSGVNLDEEVMNMMRYQQSYNAAARLMTAMDEILDKLINSTGVVGR